MAKTNALTVRSDEPSVVGGIDLPPHLIGQDDDVPGAPTDELGRHLYSLISLHPELELNVRAEDINALDDDGKRALLSDIRAMLNIPKFKGESF